DESGSMAKEMSGNVNCTSRDYYCDNYVYQCDGGDNDGNICNEDSDCTDDDEVTTHDCNIVVTECTGNDDVCGGGECVECISRAQVAHEVMGYAISELFGTFEDTKINIGIRTFKAVSIGDQCVGGDDHGNSCGDGGDCDSGSCEDVRVCSSPTISELVDSEQISEILISVYDLDDYPINGTPTVVGFNSIEMEFNPAFGYEEADEKILVFIGDGAASNACGLEYSCSNNEDMYCDPNNPEPYCGAGVSCLANGNTPYSVARDAADRLKDDLGVKIYTAAILTDDQSSDIGQMAHYSSEDCEGLNYYARSDCESPTGVPYAYVADTASEFQEMFDAIIDAIRGISVTYITTIGEPGNETTLRNSGIVLDGIGLPIPLPAGFECDDEEIGVPFRVEFNGTGPVTLENITVEYCPLW
ncbi:MAG: hypothetical protein V1695_02985, partial [Candidatus Uhrbacteria bacterium]